MAHFVTASPDGPKKSPVGFLWDEETVWLIGTSHNSFPNRPSSDPRCVIGIVDFDVGSGVLRHVRIRGAAEILAIDQTRLARPLVRYLGPDKNAWDPWFVEHVVSPLDLMIPITPKSIIAKDMSHFKTRPCLATSERRPVMSGGNIYKKTWLDAAQPTFNIRTVDVCGSVYIRRAKKMATVPRNASLLLLFWPQLILLPCIIGPATLLGGEKYAVGDLGKARYPGPSDNLGHLVAQP